jgi:signal transduction histidine kinase
MTAQIEQTVGRQEDVFSLLSQIAGLIFETENPLSHAYEIVRQTAISQKADISTLFVVEQNTLVLKGGVAFLRGNEMELPKPSPIYQLDWSVKRAEDMEKRGLTAFVAVSGQSLSISSLKELLEHPTHHGRWDKYIYPDPKGIYNLETGFGCMYAVPIKRSQKGEPRDTVLGVFKIERRKNRPLFSDQDKRIFDLVAAHLSLLLQTYYRAQNRVFSDVAHAIGGGLGRSLSTLTMCQDVIAHRDTKPDAAFDYLKSALPHAVEMLGKAIQRLESVLNAARDPTKTTIETIQRLWASVRTEVELKANIKLNETKAEFLLDPPLSMETTLQLPSLQYLDLSSILGNLLDNAVRHSGASAPVLLRLSLDKKDRNSLLVFEVTDNGKGIHPEVVKGLENTAYGEVFHLPGTTGVGSGTGLRRIYGLANLNKWVVTCTSDNGTRFRIETPDYRLLHEKREKKSE